MSAVQILALVSGLAGLGATIGATVSNEWRATSRASSVITATWVLQGLWNNCAGNAIGAVHCRPHHTILQLQGYIQACRGLMIAAICLGFFGSIFALVGMKCTKIGGSDGSKAKIACLAGVNFVLSGTNWVRLSLLAGLGPSSASSVAACSASPSQVLSLKVTTGAATPTEAPLLALISHPTPQEVRSPRRRAKGRLQSTATCPRSRTLIRMPMCDLCMCERNQVEMCIKGLKNSNTDLQHSMLLSMFSIQRQQDSMICD
ncbi:claudin-8-like isoform X2 [Nelusetta ayraudi]|uniref:claudin-8-like isoform X2 n=1 Tax=Nelusetta ayraudi TaxID=303726 RepID=UPI003F70D1D2